MSGRSAAVLTASLSFSQIKNQLVRFQFVSHLPVSHPMIQNGPPAAALLLASFKMIDKSHAF